MARVDFYTSRVTQLREGRRGKRREERGKHRRMAEGRNEEEGRKEEGGKEKVRRNGCTVLQNHDIH